MQVINLTHAEIEMLSINIYEGEYRINEAVSRLPGLNSRISGLDRWWSESLSMSMISSKCHSGTIRRTTLRQQ